VSAYYTYLEISVISAWFREAARGAWRRSPPGAEFWWRHWATVSHCLHWTALD